VCWLSIVSQSRTILKIGFRPKIKADSHFYPPATIEYVEELKCESNTDSGLKSLLGFHLFQCGLDLLHHIGRNPSGP